MLAWEPSVVKFTFQLRLVGTAAATEKSLFCSTN